MDRPTTSTVRQSLRRLPRRQIMSLAVLCLLAVAAARLAMAPIALPVAGLVERAAADRTGLELSIDRVAARVSLDGVALVLNDVGTDAATIGRVVLRQGWSGRTVTAEDVALRLAPPAGDPVVPPAPSEALAALDGALARVHAALGAAGVERAHVTGGRIDLTTAQGRGPSWRGIEAEVVAHEGLVASVRMDGAEGPVSLRVERAEGPAGIELKAQLAGLSPIDLAPAGPVVHGFAISAELDAVRPRAGPTEARLSVGIGGGTLVFGPDPPRVFDGGDLAFELRGDGRTLALLPSTFRAGGSTVVVEGTIVAGVTPDAPWVYDITAPHARLHSADLDKTPVTLSEVVAGGRIDFPGQLVHLDRLRAVAPTGRIDAAMTFDLSPSGPALSGAARIGSSTVDTLLGTWPPAIAYPARDAIARTVLGGIVRGGDLEMALDALELDPDPLTKSEMEGRLSVDADFLAATLTAPELPIAVTRAVGVLRLRDETMSLQLTGGRVTTAHGDLIVSEGALTIPALGADPAEANISATLEGPLSAVAALAATLDVPALAKSPIDPNDVVGTVRATLAVWTPLRAGVTMDERRWSIDAVLTDAGSTQEIGGQAFADADLEVLINPRRLAARGTATIDGLRVDVNYSEVFSGDRSGAARFVLTDRDRRAHGFDTGSFLTGPVVVTVEADGPARSFSADLSEAAVELPGVRKPAGEPLSAEGLVAAEGEDEPRALDVEDFKMEGGGISLAGRISVDDGAFEEAVFDRFALSDGDRAQLSITRDGERYEARFDATTFDARRLVRAMTGGPNEPSGGEGDDGPPVALRATAERVRVGEAATVRELQLQAVRADGSLSELSASGRLDGTPGGAFAATLAPEAAGSRDLAVEIADLGRVLSAFGIYERMQGGRTHVAAKLSADGTMEGTLTATDFAFANEVTLEAIIARTQRIASREGSGPNTSALAFQARSNPSTALTFDLLNIAFVKRGDVVTVREAILRGPVIGGTANGTVDLGTGELRVNGTLIPAYGVNNLFGRLPLFGEILGGGDDGGLIGVTFRLSGPLDGPRLLVNPLSAVAPGIFRRIFEFR